MRLASYLCSTPQYKKRNVYRHDPGFPTNHQLRYRMVPQIALPARYTTIQQIRICCGCVKFLTTLCNADTDNYSEFKYCHLTSNTLTCVLHNEFTCKPMNLSRLQHFYFCGPTWIRTTDTCIFSAVLYQLSYRPNKAFLQVESSKTTIYCWQGGIRTPGGVLLVGLTARTVRPLRQPTNFW